ncbi:hypothetical protein CAEBREN_14374 [Caenorhabditis brenneri]|uniref:Uncharacterized protein n=1 Tax=Caenorhabditis brenneri TaxID=135651 RepID=G0MW82_CAEBE|nr:hypothetical protein CAEBREN_14374 [Caenorhabditis brenneri]
MMGLLYLLVSPAFALAFIYIVVIKKYYKKLDERAMQDLENNNNAGKGKDEEEDDVYAEIFKYGVM